MNRIGAGRVHAVRRGRQRPACAGRRGCGRSNACAALSMEQALNRPGFEEAPTLEDGAMNKSNKFSPKVRERAVRMVQEHRGDYPSLWAAVELIAPKISFAPQTLLELQRRGSRCRRVRRSHHGTGAAGQGSRARGQETAPGQRDPEAGERVFRLGDISPLSSPRWRPDLNQPASTESRAVQKARYRTTKLGRIAPTRVRWP